MSNTDMIQTLELHLIELNIKKLTHFHIHDERHILCLALPDGKITKVHLIIVQPLINN